MEFVVENDGCGLYVVSRGSGPVLLLIHGVACDGSYFEAAAAYLAEYYTVVIYDRRGYSRSKIKDKEFLEAGQQEEDEKLSGSKRQTAGMFGVEKQVEDARAILDAMGCKQAIVAGCSAGGIIALELAHRYPDRVKMLFLHEPAVGATSLIQQQIDQWMADLKKASDGGKIMKALLILVQAMGGMDPKAPGKSLGQQKQDLENLDIFLKEEMQDFLDYGKRRIEVISLKMPCVLAVGTQDGEGLFSRAGEAAAKYLGCPLIHVPGYHNFASDRPHVFANILHESIQSMK